MRIAIAGFGIEGKASYKYWSTHENELVIVDEQEISAGELPSSVNVVMGKNAFSHLHGFDIVVRTASLSPQKLITDGKIWSATNEFFAQCPAPIIGVTGTKGKGTTCSLIASILRAAGKTVHLVGNIGTPALSILPDIHEDDIVVFELSSFQLWDLEASPHVAVVLLVEPDHLNVHGKLDNYLDAKKNIARFQCAQDTIVYNGQNTLSIQIANLSKANTKIEYPFDISGVSHSLKLLGHHNVENASAAIAAVREYVADEDTIRRGLASFEGLPHRIEFLRELHGVRYYNDSFSSAPSATVAAIKSFTQPIVLIVGGVDKGADFTGLHETLQMAPNIKKVILIGAIRRELAKQLSDISCVISEAMTMSEIVARAAVESMPGDVVVLSPGAASFDMFKDFSDRGDQFRKAVQAMS